MKYAVYILVVEDTEENDLAIGSGVADNIDRVKGDLDYDEAVEMVEFMKTNTEHLV